MKLVLLTIGVSLLAVTASFLPALMRPNNVYGAPIGEVHRILAAMRIPDDAEGPLGKYPVVKVDDEPTAINWAGGPRGAIECTAKLTATSDSTTQVDMRCQTDRPNSSAMLTLARIGMTEQIDSTLRGRPYNRQAVTIGAGAVAAITTAAPDRPTAAPIAPPFEPSADMPPPLATLPPDPPPAPPPSYDSPVIDPAHVM